MPGRFQYVNAIKQWLTDNGVSAVRLGWQDPTRESLGNCELPLCGIIPMGASMDTADAGPGTFETEDFTLVFWTRPSNSPFDADLGGFKGLWELRDRLLAAESGVKAFKEPSGGPNSPYFSAQVDLSQSHWEDYWYALDSIGYPGGELTLKVRNYIGPNP